MCYAVLSCSIGPNPCDPMDCSQPGSSVHGILQARILEWVAMPSSRGSPQPRDQTQVFCTAGDSLLSEPQEKPYSSMLSHFSRVRLCATPWSVSSQAPLSLGFPRQEYWSGLPFPSPGDLPDPRIKPRSPELKADSLPSEPPLATANPKPPQGSHR